VFAKGVSFGRHKTKGIGYRVKIIKIIIVSFFFFFGISVMSSSGSGPTTIVATLLLHLLYSHKRHFNIQQWDLTSFTTQTHMSPQTVGEKQTKRRKQTHHPL
jgi:hypothetical protein